MGRPTLRTKLCEMLDIEYPVVSAGMGPSLIGQCNRKEMNLRDELKRSAVRTKQQ